MMHNYTIGVDFGTLSGRAVLVDTTTGEEVAVAVHEYSHGVMDEKLPDGTPLGVDWAAAPAGLPGCIQDYHTHGHEDVNG